MSLVKKQVIKTIYKIPGNCFGVENVFPDLGTFEISDGFLQAWEILGAIDPILDVYWMTSCSTPIYLNIQSRDTLALFLSNKIAITLLDSTSIIRKTLYNTYAQQTPRKSSDFIMMFHCFCQEWDPTFFPMVLNSINALTKKVLEFFKAYICVDNLQSHMFQPNQMNQKGI